MSSHTATLHFDGGPVEGCEVVRYGHGFVQGIDQTGQPNTEVHGSMIGVQIVSTAEAELTKWMLDPFGRRSGRVVFKRNDQDSTFVETIFEDAYCISYRESLRPGSTHENSSLVNLYLSPKQVTIRGLVHKASWD